MADPIADNADFAVDELKRRARRRLVGAIVLALAAATILPMLLEQEQKPLGDDVSVRIPPIDGGQFVTRLGVENANEAAPDAKSGAGPIKSGGDGAAAPEPGSTSAPPAPVPAADGATPSQVPKSPSADASHGPPDTVAKGGAP